jgi:glycosyltransferase involved in cell wall biosynthesis
VKQSKILVFRKKQNAFHSIENVFNALMPHLNIEAVYLPNESRGLFKRILNIILLLRKKAALIAITGHDHYLLWYPFKNVILTIHDIEALRRKRGLKRQIFKFLWFDIPIRNAKVVTTISSFSQSEIKNLGNYSTPIKVIYNPLSLSLTYSRKEFNVKKPTILHIGTKQNKNLNRLIEALEGLRCELIILGKVSSTIRHKIDELGIECAITSGLSEQEMLDLYKEIDLLAFVSTYEGFGLPIIEAQAVGRPVLTSNVASMPEVAGEGAYFVDPFSVEAIRNGILELINNHNLREELIEKGRENVKRFEPKKIAAQYQELYDELANES